MDFRLSEEHEGFRRAARDLVEREIAPRARELDASGEMPWANVRALADLGYFGINIPEEYGGIGADSVSLALVVEEIARGCAATALIYEVHCSLCAEVIKRFGSEQQKRKYLPLLASGKSLGAFALTEPGAGSDAGSAKTSAVADGQRYVLEGQKCFITSGNVAGVFVVFAMTDKSKGTKGMSAFIVEGGSPGLKAGRVEDKMGLRASPAAEVFFDGCVVPRENLIGAEGDGFKIAMTALDSGRIGVAAQATGIAQAALEAAARYSRERVQFGQPISSFQAIQFMLAEMATDIEAARLMYRRAAWMHSQGMRCTKEAAMAKMFASSAAVRASIKAVQVHGGYGYMREYNVERYLRDSKVTEIYEGTNEIMKLVIASQVLKEIA
ncbi:MAG: acyl-CoA dehydrogenase family protein [Firmicutes bacterium]|nr:acyl-CoA dehydrogenase family protein [Bacillota bacterium]